MPKEYVPAAKTVNGYRISFSNGKWQAVKDGRIHKSHMLMQVMVRWAKNN